ncbi:hypothetical protein ACHAXS_011872 [Conticribra weissflogii]
MIQIIVSISKFVSTYWDAYGADPQDSPEPDPTWLGKQKGLPQSHKHKFLCHNICKFLAFLFLEDFICTGAKEHLRKSLWTHF